VDIAEEILAILEEARVRLGRLAVDQYSFVGHCLTFATLMLG